MCKKAKDGVQSPARAGDAETWLGEKIDGT
jgi:hypothetical protein